MTVNLILLGTTALFLIGAVSFAWIASAKEAGELDYKQTWKE